MSVIGYLAIAIAAVCVLWPMSATGWKKRSLGYALCIGLFCVGLACTETSPYVFVLGLVMAGLSQLRWFSGSLSGWLLRFGLVAITSSVLVLAASLFQNPWSGVVEREDRTEWEPTVDPKLTDADKLDAKWSTDDTNADWPVTELMLDLCEIAYKDPSDARSQLKDRGFESETISSGSMNGYVLKSGETAVVLLRGTESSVFDVLQDLLFIRSTNDNGSMHGGFRKGYSKSMHEQVSNLLARFGAKRVWVTGHSLGGALAVVCAHDLLENAEYQIAGVMTFGQPMVVQQAMKDYLEPRLRGKYAFFVNDMDPVTRAVEPYIHFGHMVRLKEGIIERSGNENLVFGSAPGEQPDDRPLDPMSKQDLDTLIEQLDPESPAVQKFDEDGRPLMMGFFPDPSDHYLQSYRAMVTTLLTGDE